MDWIANPEAWIALATLATLEIVLGIDNIVFISILAEKLPEDRQAEARKLGLLVAMATRIALLLAIAWVMSLTRTLFELVGHPFSGRDLILIVGGLFLLAKATREIHDKLEGAEPGDGNAAGRGGSFAGVLVQIMLLDLVFSLDSVITAVGMAEHVAVMVIAIVMAVLVMMLAVDWIALFVMRHPTVKMLALSFLLLIGMTLLAEGLGQHISKGYIYFAMGFSVFVEILNLRAVGTRGEPVHLRDPRRPGGAEAGAEGAA